MVLSPLTALALSAMTALSTPTLEPTRVILIQADDLGVDDLGSSGNPWVETPHLDRLARESVRLTDCTVNPVCAPSRATLLTGRHFLKTGVSHVHGGLDHLHLEEVTLADHFRAAGWRTALWGKWHLGTTPGYQPWDRGFDTAWSLRLYRHRSAIAHTADATQATERWADEVIFDQALAHLAAHPHERSFLYLASLTPHAPLDAPEDLVRHYQAKGLSPNLARLYAMVGLLDQQVGRLLTFLDEQGLAEDTLLLFTSDNGPAINDGLLSDEDRRLRRIGARRGWKGDLWENGVQAPLFVRWPAGLAPRVVTEPFDQVDLAPTLLAWCGVAPRPGSRLFDGIDRRARFGPAAAETPAEVGPTSAPTAPVEERPIFNYAHPGWLTGRRAYNPRGLPGEYNPPARSWVEALTPEPLTVSVRLGRYKLTRNPDPPDEGGEAPQRWFLADLWTDPGETTDRAPELPEVTARLRRLLEEWVTQVRQEPHAFTSPVLPLDPAAENPVRWPAKHLAAVAGGLQNTVAALQGWSGPGDAATYDLACARTGFGRLTLHWTAPPPAGTVFRLAVTPGAETTAVADGSITTVGPALELPAGPCRLTVTWSSDSVNPPETPATLDSLEWGR